MEFEREILPQQPKHVLLPYLEGISSQIRKNWKMNRTLLELDLPDSEFEYEMALEYLTAPLTERLSRRSYGEVCGSLYIDSEASEYSYRVDSVPFEGIAYNDELFFNPVSIHITAQEEPKILLTIEPLHVQPEYDEHETNYRISMGLQYSPEITKPTWKTFRRLFEQSQEYTEQDIEQIEMTEIDPILSDPELNALFLTSGTMGCLPGFALDYDRYPTFSLDHFQYYSPMGSVWNRQ